MQHNYRGGLELSVFQILTEIIGGSLSGFLNTFFKLHFINNLHWTASHSRLLKEKARPHQHSFISLFFVALNIFSVIFKVSCCLLSEIVPAASGGCHPSQASTPHSFPAALSAPCPGIFWAPAQCPAQHRHSTGVTRTGSSYTGISLVMPHWKALSTSHHISHLPADFVF